MINIRKDLIAKELERDIENGFTFIYRSLSNKLLDNLYNKYNVMEACENFYDSEPHIDSYISDLAYMYKNSTEEDLINPERYFTLDYILKTYNKEYNREEAKRASEFVESEYNKYNKSDRRIEFCNWQEPYFNGNWGMSQKYVNDMSKDTLKNFRQLSVSKKNRVYFAKKDDEIRIYLYGRDIIYKDWWFIFKKI